MSKKEKRSAIIVRVPDQILKDLDKLISQYKSEHPMGTWSRNNVVVAAIKTMIEYAKK